MNQQDYQDFTKALTASLGRRADVLGLIALGSMASDDYQPDRWSDHDFFVVARPGAQEGLRTDLSWLPDSSRIAFSYRETEHGLKVVYDNAHLLEFAVFDPDELAMARINRYRVLLDGERIGERIRAVRDQTTASAGHPMTDAQHFGQLLTIILVGTGRYRRGERLSGHHFVRFSALYHLIPMLVRHIPAERKSLLDNLDPFRRFDLVYPELGAELDAILVLPPPQAGLGLLEFAEKHLRPRVTDFPEGAFRTIRKALSE